MAKKGIFIKEEYKVKSNESIKQIAKNCPKKVKVNIKRPSK